MHYMAEFFYTTILVVSKRKSLIVHKHEPLSLAGADMARGIASWEQRQSSDLQNLVSQRGAEIFK